MRITMATLSAPLPGPAPERGLLACPVCGSRQVVLTHLDCRALGPMCGEVTIGPAGLRIDPAMPNPEGGATVGVHCICAQGHASVIRLRQVRGATTVERTILPWTTDPARIGTDA